MGMSLPDDIGYPTTKGFVKKHNRKSRKIFKRKNSKQNRKKPLDVGQEDGRMNVLNSNVKCTQFYLTTRQKMEKEHHDDQRGKDIDRATIRRTESE